jgi:hypothetical protein
MNQYKRINNIVGWFVFAIAAATYILTVEPTVSWWDPGEHIATAYKLQVGHPPGAPTFGMVARLFSLMAFGDTTKVAVMINMISVFSSAFCILFLFWTITMLARKIVAPDNEMTPARTWTIMLAGFIGAVTYTFTDSFWFSAVEANVFAMSYFCTAVVFWAILKWELVADEKHHYRWLIFITFMIGISIGVHLLNLLTIPALAFVYYFKKFKPSRKGIFLNLAFSFFILASIMYVVIPWIPKLAGKIEIIFVNGFGLPFNSGLIFYFLMFIGLIVWGLWYTRKKTMPVLNTIILCFTFLLIGYTSFLTLVIRSNANTPINEDAPKDAVSLVPYLNREQYGSWPFLYGQFYTAPIVDWGDGSPLYKRDNASGQYIIVNSRKGTVPIYDKRFTSVFPRMWSTQRKGGAEFYKEWGGKGVPIEVTNQEGKTETIYRPTFAENIRFFLTYQVSWMYLRYLMWNFSGRQNDEQGFGGIRDGNWITGIPFIDKMRIGHAMSGLPDSLNTRMSHKYYMLPFLLALAGFFFQVKKDYRGSIVISLLFLMTGLAIVTYLNQQPYEPRERDYSYGASFYAFSIWIGLGVLYLIDVLKTRFKMKEMIAIGVVAVLSTLLVPGIVAKEDWHDHDRSRKYAARDFAADYLNSCDKQAILFTNGDNDTFPLWYNQEVEGVRTDVRVVNLELASGSWYISQMFRKVYTSETLPFTLSSSQYQEGTNDYVPFYDRGIKGYIELKDLMDFIHSDNPDTYIPLQSGEKIKYFPSKKIKLTVNHENCLKYGIVPEYFKGKMVDTIYWTIKSNYLYKNDLAMLDIIATSNWTRPIYFAAPGSVTHCFNADQYCLLEGWVYKLMPVKADSNDYMQGMGGVDGLGSYDMFMHKCAWGNLSDPRVYIDPESFNNSLRPKMEIVRTAQNLLTQGKLKETANILDLYMKHFPQDRFPYDASILAYADFYFQAGENEKGSRIIERLAQMTCQNLDYYNSFPAEYKSSFNDDTQTSMSILKRMNYMASEYHQIKLAAKMDSLFNMEMKRYK